MLNCFTVFATTNNEGSEIISQINSEEPVAVAFEFAPESIAQNEIVERVARIGKDISKTALQTSQILHTDKYVNLSETEEYKRFFPESYAGMFVSEDRIYLNIKSDSTSKSEINKLLSTAKSSGIIFRQGAVPKDQVFQQDMVSIAATNWDFIQQHICQ